MTEGLGVQGARDKRGQTEGCRTGGAHLAGRRDSGTGGHGGGEVLQAPSPAHGSEPAGTARTPPRHHPAGRGTRGDTGGGGRGASGPHRPATSCPPGAEQKPSWLLRGLLWMKPPPRCERGASLPMRGAFWGVPPQKKWSCGVSQPRPGGTERDGKREKRGRGSGAGGGAANAHLLGGLRGPDERGSSPPWGRGVTLMRGRPGSVLGTTRRCVPGGPRCPGGEPGGPPAAAGLWMWPCPPAAPSPPHRAVPWCPRPGGHRLGWSWWPRAGSDPIVPQPPRGHPGGQQSPPTPHPPAAERRSRGGRWQSWRG